MCAVEEWHVQFLIATAISTPQIKQKNSFFVSRLIPECSIFFCSKRKKREHFQHLIAYFIGFFLITVIFNEINVLDIISTLFFFFIFSVYIERQRNSSLSYFANNYFRLQLPTFKSDFFFCAFQAWVLLYLKPHKFICFQNVYGSEIKHKKYELKKRT